MRVLDDVPMKLHQFNVILISLSLATGCAAAGDSGQERPSSVATAESEALAAAGQPQEPPGPPGLIPGETSLAAALRQPPPMPPADVADEVAEAADVAASGSEMTLQHCTDWLADSATTLAAAKSQDCTAILAAAVRSCEELDCFTPPDDEPARSTTARLSTATTTAPATTTTALLSSTTTAAPATTTTATAATTTSPATTTEVEAEPDPAPEGGHPPSPTAGMIPRDEPYWDYPTCTGSAPWPSDCFPPSEWEVPQDLSECMVAPLPDSGVGGVCASRRPDRPPHKELPRQTRDVVEFIDWCESSWHPLSCKYVLFQMKWSLDYLGAHPWCVLQQYYDRIAAHDDVWNRGYSPPRDVKDRHGWSGCATVIDPPSDADPALRLSETGISLAEQCRIVLPADVQLEDRPSRVTTEPNRFGSDCDSWAEWVESREKSRDWRKCDRAARLAEEWMEHHHDTPERYFNVYC